MTYYDEIRLDAYGQTSIRVPTVQDRFDLINRFLHSIKEFCLNPTRDDNTLLISASGKVWINDDTKYQRSNLARNHIIYDIRCVNDIANISDIREIMYRAEFNDFSLKGAVYEELKQYNIVDANPKFFGIEISFIASNHFALASNIIQLTGPGAETFFNVRALMK